ncbi:hypothetical protein BKA61DRAFT_711875 [Leptodontidium sp. MPI-SDFR-AT-0119]|nr:hypothetical protein BKA61DRAFT_711875 [Leptodontidium sp. MPI-SDFR-AT-0119]
MASASSNDLVAFTLGTRVAFSQYLSENPNNRRVSQNDKEMLIEWLTNPDRRPQSQEEFSRRNYVRKTFIWDEKSQILLAVAKKDGDKSRKVITTDMIADIVETVHKDNNHAGWDATWKDVSTSYYGILRADVIFLLKQCQNQHCSQNPSKRPKGSTPTAIQSQQSDHEFIDFLSHHQEDDMYGGGNPDWRTDSAC